MKYEDLDKILDPNDFSWIKVKRNYLKRKDNPDGHLAIIEFNQLIEHHNSETEFLINKCRELAQELKRLKEIPEPTIVPWDD